MTQYSPKHLFHELSRRRVITTVMVYIAGTWVALQVAELAFPGFDVPEQAIAYVWLGAFLLFPLVLVFGWKYDIHVTGIQRTPALEVEDDFDTSLQKPDHWLIGGMGAVAIAVIATMLVLITRVEPSDFKEVTPNSIAVMPFIWCHETAGDIALAGGIHTAVINRLASRERLKVIGRNSVYNMVSVGLPNDQVSELLRVQYLLHGELCRDGVDLVLQAELTDNDRAIVWSGNFRQVVVRGDQVKQQLATLVANGVALELGEVAMADSLATVHVRALELLRIAQFHREKDQLEEAESALVKALDYEPDYAEAMFALAGVRAQQAQDTADNHGSYLAYIEEGWPYLESALALARAEIERGTRGFQAYAVAAQILDSMAWLKKEQTWRESGELGETELAARKVAEIDLLLEAEEHLRNAIRLNPTDSGLRSSLAHVLAQQGPERRGETLEILEQARRTEPFDEPIAIQLALNLALRGQYERAMEELERFKALGEMSTRMENVHGEIQIDYHAWDDVLEGVLEALQNEPEKFKRVWPWIAGFAWFSSDLPYLGLNAEAEELYQILVSIPVRADEKPGETWARQWFLLDKYRQATGRAEEVAREQVLEVEGLSNEEVVDRWYLRAGVIGQSFWILGERDRAIELFETLRHHRLHPRWAQRTAEMKLGLVRMYLLEGRSADAAPVLEELVDFLEVELAAGVRHPSTLFDLASAYAAQGHHDEALEMLAMAVDYGFYNQAMQYVESEAGERFLWGVPWGVEWYELEGDPRYERQLSRQRALADQRAANIRTMLAAHDIDQLMAPVIEMHAAASRVEPGTP